MSPEPAHQTDGCFDVHQDDGETRRRLRAIWRALESVEDPEVPVLSVIDLGMIADVRLEGDKAIVELTPTFAACPALDVIRNNVRGVVLDAGERDVVVKIVFDPPWSTDRITDEGRRKMKAFGLAPPVRKCSKGGANEDSVVQLGLFGFAEVACPHCDSTDTVTESLFGATLCRSIHYCNACRQSFEHFKPV